MASATIGACFPRYLSSLELPPRHLVLLRLPVPPVLFGGSELRKVKAVPQVQKAPVRQLDLGLRRDVPVNVGTTEGLAHVTR